MSEFRLMLTALTATFAALERRDGVEQFPQVGVLVDEDDAGAFDAGRLVADRETVEAIAGEAIHRSSVARVGDAV